VVADDHPGQTPEGLNPEDRFTEILTPAGLTLAGVNPETLTGESLNPEDRATETLTGEWPSPAGHPTLMPEDRFRFIEVKGHSGAHLYTGGPLEEALSRGYGAVELRYGWQSHNPEGWQSKYRYPAYGVGWYSGFIGNPDQLGLPGGVYGFISFPLQKHRTNVFILETALGLSYDLQPYNPDDNVYNDLIGSRINVYFNLNIGGRYKFNRELDLLYGIDLTHFSNGRTFQPNSGLNMYGFNLGLRYHFNASQRHVDNSPHPEILLDARPRFEEYTKGEKINEGRLQVYGAGGFVQHPVNKGTDKHHLTGSLVLEYAYRFSTKHGLAGGLDLFYDSSLEENFPDKKHHFYGAHLGYDYHFWNLCVRIQAGTYLHKRGHDLKEHYFYRPALQYNLQNGMFAQVGLKTRAGFRADWIEFGLGFRL